MRRASSGFGWVTTRTDALVMSSLWKTFRLATRCWIPMSDRATGAVIQPMPRPATGCMSGCATMMGMADARFTATPVKGAGAALCTSLGAFRGVHKEYLHFYVATYEAMVNTKRITPELIRRMYLGDLLEHTSASTELS